MTTERPGPSYKLLCVMTHHVLDQLGADAAVGEVVEGLKCEIARAHLAYPPPHYFTAVVDAVQLARRKGYLTPRLKRCPTRSVPQ